MTQLRAQDVRQIEGVWTINITPEAGGVKTGKARIVPIHEHLIAQGFLDVVKAQGKGPLFYNPERGRGGSDANPHYKKMGERLAAWVRKLGVDDPDVQPNHAWRHLFKTTARSVRMDPEARDTIQGHALDTEGKKYGVYPLPLLSEELAKLPRFETETPAQAPA
jgi:integrase